MPLIHHEGDLLQSDCDAIIHSCNCFNVMGAGIARQIKDKFPEAYLADQRTVKGDVKKLGTYSWARSKNKIICNLYGQYNYDGGGRKTNYEAIANGLEAIKNRFEVLYWWPKIGFPYGMGCGLEGGNWSIVEKIIEVTFADKDIHIYKLG